MMMLRVLACLATFLLANLQAAEKWVTIGDSLTKEYAIEFPLLNPDNPFAWGERNWLELLSEHRSAYVDIGQLSTWLDSRLTGHEYNWAIPGTKTSEWKEIIEATIFSNPLFVYNHDVLDGYLNNVADRVVIFLGGNDLKGKYSTHYNGTDRTPFVNSLVSNVTIIINHVRSQNATVPIVLVNMPDVGVTPVVQEEFTDPIKRQLMTDLTDDVNARLRALATQKDIGFADIASLTSELTGPRHYVIGGVRFQKSRDPKDLSNDPDYLFSPDGFHPNTPAQLLFANAIARGFNEHYPELDPVPLFSTEEMLGILGLEANVSFTDWAAAYGVEATDGRADLDGDGASLWEEFALGMDPRDADAEKRSVGFWTGERLELRYQPRIAISSKFTITPQFAEDLMTWSPIPAAQQMMSAAGSAQAWILPHGDRCFVRLSFSAP